MERCEALELGLAEVEVYMDNYPITVCSNEKCPYGNFCRAGYGENAGICKSDGMVEKRGKLSIVQLLTPQPESREITRWLIAAEL